MSDTKKFPMKAADVTIPADWHADSAGQWIGRSLADGAAMPPKKPKAHTKPRK